MNALDTRFSYDLVMRPHEVLVQVEDFKLTRLDMMTYHCDNFTAAKILNKALKPLRAKNVQELSQRLNVQTFFNLTRVGERSFYVFLIVLHHAGIDANTWVDGGQQKFATICAQVKKESKVARKRRKQLRVA